MCGKHASLGTYITVTPVLANCFILRVNGCLRLRLLGTPVDKRWVLLAFKNELCNPKRHSFHFEQVLFQSVLTRLSYQRAKKCRQMDGQTDRQTDRQTAFKLYIVDELARHAMYHNVLCYNDDIQYLVQEITSFIWLNVRCSNIIQQSLLQLYF